MPPLLAGTSPYTFAWLGISSLVMNKTSFQFKPFTDDSPAHSQLQEWADYYGVELGWEDIKGQNGGITEWTSYPIIQKHHYSEYVGSGSATRKSHKQAAELIVKSKGILDEARKRKIPVIARI
ncbi:hypothetical protein FRC12_001656 [Ceratobasidium sp. 428]|nr:hypothetical protein FRC12_001656 [Ceratobasidium sp. 428]